jgi:hypothetical protein
VAATLVLGLLVAGAAAPTWVHASGRSATGQLVEVAVGGTQAAPQVLAAALAVLAAGAALALVGRGGRWAVVVVLLGCAAIVVAGAVRALTDPAAVAASAVADRTGLAAATGSASSTPWPWVTAVLALATVAAAVWIGRARGGWSGRDRRHERPVVEDERSDWDALSHGVDPSVDDATRPPTPPGGVVGLVRREDDTDPLG